MYRTSRTEPSFSHSESSVLPFRYSGQPSRHHPYAIQPAEALCSDESSFLELSDPPIRHTFRHAYIMQPSSVTSAMHCLNPFQLPCPPRPIYNSRFSHF
jgi:hypothetical protein